MVSIPWIHFPWRETPCSTACTLVADCLTFRCRPNRFGGRCRWRDDSPTPAHCLTPKPDSGQPSRQIPSKQPGSLNQGPRGPGKAAVVLSGKRLRTAASTCAAAGRTATPADPFDRGEPALVPPPRNLENRRQRRSCHRRQRPLRGHKISPTSGTAALAASLVTTARTPDGPEEAATTAGTLLVSLATSAVVLLVPSRRAWPHHGLRST